MNIYHLSVLHINTAALKNTVQCIDVIAQVHYIGFAAILSDCCQIKF